MVIHSAIDNLLKGASGQAIQNMNLLFGLEEKTGLNLKATFFQIKGKQKAESGKQKAKGKKTEIR